ILSAMQGLPPRQRTALLLDAIEGCSHAEIAGELRIGETTVTGLLKRARGNLRLQLDEGMSCALARRLLPSLWGSELPTSQRRAAMGHPRNCERCSADAPRTSLSALLGTLVPGLRALVEPVAGLVPSGAVGLGATAAVVATATTVAWQPTPPATSLAPTAPIVQPAGSHAATVHRAAPPPPAAPGTAARSPAPGPRR